MKCLQYLNVRYRNRTDHITHTHKNKITVSDYISHMSLSFRGNAIVEENALQSLALVSKTLRALVLSENPLAETTDYRLSVLMLLPQLERLDKDPVSPEERTEAQERLKVKLSGIVRQKKTHLLFFSSNGMYVISGT